jgi:hypothetical protein
MMKSSALLSLKTYECSSMGSNVCAYFMLHYQDGEPCFVYCIGFSIGVLKDRVGDDGVNGWILVGMVNYEAESANGNRLQVITVEGGFAYLMKRPGLNNRS